MSEEKDTIKISKKKKEKNNDLNIAQVNDRMNNDVTSNDEKVAILKHWKYTNINLLEKVKNGTLTESDLSDDKYDYMDKRNIMAFYSSGDECCLGWD